MGNKKLDEELISAVMWYSIEKTEELIKLGANVNGRDDNGNTPLHYACWKGYIEKIQLLFKNKANINARNIDGDTPLHTACQWGKNKVVKFLIKNNVNVDVINKQGNTPLYEACDIGAIDIVRILLERKPNVNVKNKKNATPLYRISGYVYTEPLVRIIFSCINLLIPTQIKNKIKGISFHRPKYIF